MDQRKGFTMQLIFVAGDKEHHILRHFSRLKLKNTKKKKDDSSREKYALSNGIKKNQFGVCHF